MSTEEKTGVNVLLHSCCAPCSGAMIEELQEEGLAVTVYFYNPNIHPRKEYEIRKNENIRYAEKLGIPIVDALALRSKYCARVRPGKMNSVTVGSASWWDA